MKKIITILTICFSITVLNAQDFPFPQGSASWTYEEICADGGAVDPPRFIFFNYGGDSIVNGKHYKILTSNRGGGYLCFYDWRSGLIRTEDDKVYVLYNGEPDERLLYDFTLEPGDTMLTDNCGYPYLDSFMVVSHIDQTLIGGAYRKVWTFEGVYGSYRWIEGIGNIDATLIGPEYLLSHVLLDGCYYSLLCFSENDEQIIADTFYYFDPGEVEGDPDIFYYYSCDGIIDVIEEPLETTGVLITPNPAASFFNVSLEEADKRIQRVQVVNVLGEEIFKGVFDRQLSVEVGTSDWPPGLYLVIVNERWVEKVFRM